MVTLSGAASTAVRDLLAGPPRPWRVLGVHPRCVYLLAGSELVALESADAVGLPCAVRLAVVGSDGVLTRVRRGDRAEVGGGVLRAGPVTVRVTRWWSPRPPRAGWSAARRETLARLLAGHPSPVPADGEVGDLLGRGPGLTPAGDDLLAGLLVGLHHRSELRDPLAAEVARLARTRTTTLSATLLRHAAAGHAIPAVTAVADALAGAGQDGDLEIALDRLLRVGDTSGAALAWGLLRAAREAATSRPRETVTSGGGPPGLTPRTPHPAEWDDRLGAA
jgi:hypothetical protein